MATIRYIDENGQWQEIAVGGGESVEVVDNLESESTTAALSANQGRVLKDYVDSTIAQAITTTLNTAV